MMTPCQRCGVPFPAEASFCPTCGLARTPRPPGQAPSIQSSASGGSPPAVPGAVGGFAAGGALVGPGWQGPSASPPAPGWPQPGLAPEAAGARKGSKPGVRQPGGRSKRSRTVKIIVGVIVLLLIAGGVAGFFLYRAQAAASFVIATDRGNGQIDRIDLSTRNVTVLINRKTLPATPDSVVFISNTQVLIDFAGNKGEIGLGDIQSGTYTTISQGHNDLRDMAVRPDGSSVLIAETDGVLLEFRVSDRSVRTFVQSQNLSGSQGLAFDSNGNLYAAVGGTVVQLDPNTGRQIKTFNLPGGSDGMAYDGHRNTLDIASGDAILTLDPKTGKVGTLIDGIGGADGVAIDRHGNLFIAASAGVLELTTDNQLLIVGTDSNGATWDDVSPLSGSGAVSY